MQDVILRLQCLSRFAQKITVPRKKLPGFDQKPLHFAAEPGFLFKSPEVGVSHSGMRVKDGIVAVAV